MRHGTCRKCQDDRGWKEENEKKPISNPGGSLRRQEQRAERREHPHGQPHDKDRADSSARPVVNPEFHATSQWLMIVILQRLLADRPAVTATVSQQGLAPRNEI